MSFTKQRFTDVMDHAILAGGWIRIYDADVQTTGTITDKVFQDPGSDTILQSFTSSSLDIEIYVEASFPKVEVNAVAATLPRVGDIYKGFVNVTLPPGGGPVVAQLISPDDTESSIDTSVSAVLLPPVVTAAIFTGSYPGSQTELKEDDTYQVDVTANKNFDQVIIVDYEAGKAAVIGVTPGTNAVVALPIADRGNTAVLRPGRVRVRDAVTAALSDPYDTDTTGSVEGVNTVKCNNLYPSVSIGAVTYPGVQEALKNVEAATVANTVSNFDVIAYDDPTTSELTIANLTTYEAVKGVTRVGGTYNITAANFRITATRNANAAVMVQQDTVNIANVAAVINVATPAARLRSGGNDGTSAQNHIITIQSNQQLLSAAMDEDTGGGTFLGSWGGGPVNWTRTLQVHDDDTKATYNWQNLSVSNLAGIVTTSITAGGSYVLGGFVQRTLTFPAFSPNAAMDVEVVTFTKLQAGTFPSAGNAPAVRQAIGTPPTTDVGKEGWYTINTLGIQPTNIIWLHTPSVNANSSGTATVTNVEEVV